MWQNLTGWHALIVLAIVVLVFGAAKLPALARSVGQSVRILRSEAGDPGAEAGDTHPDPASVASDPDASPPASRSAPTPIASATARGDGARPQ